MILNEKKQKTKKLKKKIINFILKKILFEFEVIRRKARGYSQREKSKIKRSKSEKIQSQYLKEESKEKGIQLKGKK